MSQRKVSGGRAFWFDHKINKTMTMMVHWKRIFHGWKELFMDLLEHRSRLWYDPKISRNVCQIHTFRLGLNHIFALHAKLYTSVLCILARSNRKLTRHPFRKQRQTRQHLRHSTLKKLDSTTTAKGQAVTTRVAESEVKHPTPDSHFSKISESRLRLSKISDPDSLTSRGWNLAVKINGNCGSQQEISVSAKVS